MTTDVRVDVDLGGIRRRLQQQQQAQRLAYLEQVRREDVEQQALDARALRDQELRRQFPAPLSRQALDRRRYRPDELAAFRAGGICDGPRSVNGGESIRIIGTVNENPECAIDFRLFLYPCTKTERINGVCTVVEEIAIDPNTGASWPGWSQWYLGGRRSNFIYYGVEGHYRLASGGTGPEPESGFGLCGFHGYGFNWQQDITWLGDNPNIGTATAGIISATATAFSNNAITDFVIPSLMEVRPSQIVADGIPDGESAACGARVSAKCLGFPIFPYN